MSESKKDTHTKASVGMYFMLDKDNLAIRVSDSCKRELYTYQCVNSVQYYFLKFAIKKSKTSKQVLDLLKPIA